MSVQEEMQGGRMKGGGREEEEDPDGCSKRVREEEQNRDEVERQDGRSKKRRIRSENWSAEETLQLLELRRAVVQTSVAKGSDAWKQIAQQLAGLNPDSQARSCKQVAQRWDTLVKVYVSVEEQCCERGRSYSEVIDDRQRRCKAEYRQLWHELIAQCNPGKRRGGKTAVEAPASLSNGAVTTLLRIKFGEIAKSFTAMLDTIDRSVSYSSEGRREVFGQADDYFVTGSNWEPEDDQGLERTISASGLKKQQDSSKADVARATQSMTDTMQSISKAASTSESFCLEVDQKDWSMVIQRLSAFSQKLQAISVQGIRDEVGEDVCFPNSQQQAVSTVRSVHDQTNNPVEHSLPLTSSFYINGKICRVTSLSSLNTKRSEKSCSSGKHDNASPATSTGTYAGLQDIVHLSPKSDCESLSESKWLEVDRTNLHVTKTCTTSSGEEEEKLEEKKGTKNKTARRTSILQFRSRLVQLEVGEKVSRSMTRTMTRFGPRIQGLEEQKHLVE